MGKTSQEGGEDHLPLRLEPPSSPDSPPTHPPTCRRASGRALFLAGWPWKEPSLCMSLSWVLPQPQPSAPWKGVSSTAEATPGLTFPFRLSRITDWSLKARREDNSRSQPEASQTSALLCFRSWTGHRDPGTSHGAKQLTSWRATCAGRPSRRTPSLRCPGRSRPRAL